MILSLELYSISMKCLKNIKNSLFQNENNVVLNEKSVEEKPCING